MWTCTANEFWRAHNKKAPTAARVLKNHHEMGKCYPTFCAKKDIPLIHFLFFLFDSIVTSRQHGFLLFPQVSERLGGPKVSLIVDFCIFSVVGFSTEKTVKLNQNHFSLCHSFALSC